MKKINCILLIDDNTADNYFHKIVIDKAVLCNEFHVAEDGVKALEYIINSKEEGNEKEFPKPDIIFLDINMPRMDGFEFLDEYRQLEGTKSVIIMLSTSMNPYDRKKAMNDELVSEFQNKPLSVKMLVELVEKYF